MCAAYAAPARPTGAGDQLDDRIHCDLLARKRTGQHRRCQAAQRPTPFLLRSAKPARVLPVNADVADTKDDHRAEQDYVDLVEGEEQKAQHRQEGQG